MWWSLKGEWILHVMLRQYWYYSTCHEVWRLPQPQPPSPTSCPPFSHRQRLSIKRDKAHVLFGGTKILQTTGERAARLKTPDNGCLAVVLRTGFGTAQGACSLEKWQLVWEGNYCQSGCLARLMGRIASASQICSTGDASPPFHRSHSPPT